MQRRTRTGLMMFLGLLGAITMAAQPPPPGGWEQAPEVLDEIFAPIALYPDPLVALILPAATVPGDVANAAAYLNAYGDPAQIDAQPWDPSVKSLTHYPDVLRWMAENISWTQQAGDAFLAQPTDVMRSIQQLRARALAAGTLVSTPQQQVVTEGYEIRIIPTRPDVIYVPSYDPNLVYDEQPGYGGPWLTFGLGYAAGVWLNYDLDWDRHGIWIGRWRRDMDYRHPAWRGGDWNDWNRGDRNRGDRDRDDRDGHSWRPNNSGPNRQQRPGYFDSNRGREGVVRPQPFAGAQGFPGGQVRPLPEHPSQGRPPQERPAQDRAPVRAPLPHPFTPVPGARPDLRGYPPEGPGRTTFAPRPPPNPSTVFGGYNRGSDARAASERGHESRREISAPPAREPAQQRSAPPPRSEPQRSEPQRSEPSRSDPRDHRPQ